MTGICEQKIDGLDKSLASPRMYPALHPTSSRRIFRFRRLRPRRRHYRSPALPFTLNTNDTQKNGATRSIVRMGRSTFWLPSFVIWSPQNQSRQPHEDGDEETRDNCNFHDNLLG